MPRWTLRSDPGLTARDQARSTIWSGGSIGDAEVLPFPAPAAFAGRPGPASGAPGGERAYVAGCSIVGEDLCSEPPLVLRHAARLQDLDISSQILGHMRRCWSRTVLSSDRVDRMTGLRKRLLRTATLAFQFRDIKKEPREGAPVGCAPELGSPRVRAGLENPSRNV